MITDWFLGLFTRVAGFLSGILPSGHIDIPGTAGVAGFLGDINYFLPVGEVFAAVAAVLAIGPALLTTKIIMWLTIGVMRGGSPSAG